MESDKAASEKVADVRHRVREELQNLPGFKTTHKTSKNSDEEYEHIEFKESLSQQREGICSLAAFATTRGGKVSFGIKPNGDKCGLEIGKNTLENLANEIKQNTDPPLYPSIDVEPYKDRHIIHVTVDESSIKPVWAYGTPYKRMGRTSQKVLRDETARLMEATSGRTWDSLVPALFSSVSLSQTRVREFLKLSQQDVLTPVEDVLTNLGFVGNRGPCNAALLLFAENPQQFLPGAQIKCAIFSGTEAVTFIDEQTLSGNVIEQVQSAIAFVIRNTRQGIKISGRPERETVSEYPQEAVREAIINAICHRDYTSTGTIQIRILDDRMEIWNPGVLPSALTVEDLYVAHPSKPRNPLLAQALHYAKFIEKWGTGTVRIVKACEDIGMPRPIFASAMGSFKVTFTKSVLVVFSREIIEKIGKERLEKMLQEFMDRGKLTTKQIGSIFQVSIPTARTYLRLMAKEGVIYEERKYMTDPNAYWILKR